MYSVWQTPPNGGKFGIETLLIEVDTREEAERICKRLVGQGIKARVAGPHEPMDDDPSNIPLEY